MKYKLKTANQIIEESFEKIASTTGTAASLGQMIPRVGGAVVGAAIPTVGGIMLGNKIGKKKNNSGKLKEQIPELDTKIKSLKDELGGFSAHSVYPRLVASRRIDNDEYANLTVGEAAKKLYDEMGFTNDDIMSYITDSNGYSYDFAGIDKKASFKSAIGDFALGAAATSSMLGPILGTSGFAYGVSKNNQNNEQVQRVIDEKQREIKMLNRASEVKRKVDRLGMQGGKSYFSNIPKEDKMYSLMDHQGDFGGIKSVIVNSKFGDHGYNYDIQMIDNKLKDLGYDINKMNFKQYRQIVDDVYNNVLWKDDKWQGAIDDEYMNKYRKK